MHVNVSRYLINNNQRTATNANSIIDYLENNI